MAPSATWQHKIKRCLEEDEGDFLQVIKTLSPEEKDEALLSLIIDHFDAGHAHPGLTRINSILNEFRQVNQEIIAVRRRLALFHEVIPSPGDLVGPSGDGGGRNSGEDTKDNHVGHTEYVGRGSNPDEDSKNDVAVTYDQVAISQGSQRANDHVESSVPVACGANNLVKPSLSLVLPRPGIASSCRASGHVGSAAAVALLGNYFTGDGGGRNSNEGNKSDVFAECNGRVKRPRSRRWKNRARLSGYGGGGGYSVEDSRNDVAGGNGRVPWRGSSWANKPVGSSVIEYLPLVFASVGRNSDEASTSYAFPDNNRSRRANNLVRPAVTVILPPSRYFYADNVGGRNFGKCPESDVVSRSNHQATSPGSRPVNDHAELSGNGGGRTSNNESTERNIIAHGNCWD